MSGLAYIPLEADEAILKFCNFNQFLTNQIVAFWDIYFITLP